MSRISDSAGQGRVGVDVPFVPSQVSHAIERVIGVVISLFKGNTSSSNINPDLSEKIQTNEKFQRRSIEGIVSSPREIKGNLSDEYTIAPSRKALADVKSKMAEGDKKYAEVVLQSILQAEDLAHALYERREDLTSQPGNIKVRTYHDDGSFAADIKYEVKRVDTPEGLNAFILVPKNVPEDITPEVKMIFVGTKDFEGVVRDVEDGAAGNESFKNYENTLLADLNAAVGKVEGKDVKISIIGHSLGGADAQRMVAKITQVVANPDAIEANPDLADSTYAMFAEASGLYVPQENYSSLRNKNLSLRLETSAAPALTKEQCAEFVNDLRNATANNENFEFRAIASIYRLDFVPTCGEKNVIANREILSLSAQAIVVYIESKPFQHESEIFKSSGQVEEGDVQILQTNQNDPDDDVKKNLHEKMIDILTRSSGIDRLAFIKAIKKAFKKLAIKKGWVPEALYPEAPFPQSPMRVSL